jgi:cytidylate kinase
MTTVVFPEASLKVYLTAQLEVRAQRRQLEYTAKGIHLDRDALQLEIQKRDEADEKRELAPLKIAEDAHILDTSHLSIDEVVDHIIALVH